MKKDGSELVVTVKLGHKLTGHPSILHGGITALLFDNALGWTVYVSFLPRRTKKQSCLPLINYKNRMNFS